MAANKISTVILTGASSGIGEQMARLLAAKNYRLILVSRNEERLKKLCIEISQIHKISCEYFVCDLSSETELEKLMQKYPETDILINNAGFSSYGYFEQLQWKNQKDMLMVNIFALSRLCHHYLKGMKERNFGRILNVASTAGNAPIPFNSTYVGTKAFVIQFSKSLALESANPNVTISCLLPGPTATNFWQVSNMQEKVTSCLKNYDQPKDVAAFGIKLMEKGIIYGTYGWKNKFKQIIKRALPEKLWYRIIKKHMLHPSLTKHNK